MKARKFSIVLVCFLFLGCAARLSQDQIKIVSDLSLYQLYIDENGNLLDPVSHLIVENEKEYIDDIFVNFQKQVEKRGELTLSVFIHGGLNTFKSSTSRVTLKNKILDDGKYPLFVSWNSEASSNYFDHLFMMRRGNRAPILGPLSSPFVFLEDFLRSIARLPASTYNVLFGQNSVRISFYSKEEKASDAALRQLPQMKFRIYNNPHDTGHSFTDWATVWNPTKIVTAPFIDGLGTGAWNSMLRRTDLVLRKNVGFEGAPMSYADTAVSKFLTMYIKKYPDRQTEIIGHSMGTIIANNIIAKYSDIKFTNIVYMAAACRLKDLEYVVAPYLEKNSESQFYNLSLNPYRDLSENSYYDFIPRGSLLVWIDQTLGYTNSFQDRTAGFWFNIVRGAGNTFQKEHVRKRVHLTQFGIKDGTPQNHGDFDDFKFWKKKFWQGIVEP
jgi:pimeloyl-ACP methyl ester carboxylesterase